MWDVNGTLMNLALYIFRTVATYKQVYYKRIIPVLGLQTYYTSTWFTNVLHQYLVYKRITPVLGLQTYPYMFQLQPVLSTV